MSGTFQLNNKQLNRFIFFLTAVVLLFMFKYRFAGESGDDYKRVVNGDGKGYYAYLPAVFIYHDLTFSFFDKDEKKFGYQYSNTFLLNHNQKNLNKYTCGEAILLIPFFLLAIIYSWFMGLPVDGYNGTFQIFCALGNLFYFMMGLIITKKVLRWYGISNRSIAISLFAITLGTNLLNYIVYESSMSHVFSFFTIALNVYAAKRFFESPSLRIILLGGLTLGLIILIRPINGMIVFAYPFLAGEKNFFLLVKTHLRYFLLAGILACGVIFIQLILWKLSLGQFLVYGYKNEGFYFNRPPALAEYLFSFKRGAFIYSPVLLLSFLGLWNLRRERQSVGWLVFFLLVVLYFHASWWSWYYGDGLGERPLIDFYIFFALLLALAFERTKGKLLRIALFSLLGLFILLHQVFFYQYTKGIIHPYSMDHEKFSHVFLKTSDQYRNLYKCESEEFYSPHGVQVVDSMFYSMMDTNEVVPKKLKLRKNHIRQGEYFVIDDNYLFTYETVADSSWLYKWRYAEVSFDFYQPLPDSAASHMSAFVTMNGKGPNSSYYNANQLQGAIFNTTGTWMPAFERLKIGIPEEAGVIVHVFIDNVQRKKLFVRNFKVRIVEAKP